MVSKLLQRLFRESNLNDFGRRVGVVIILVIIASI